MTNEIKGDNEFSWMMAGCGLFTIVLLFVDFLSKTTHSLLASGWFYPFIGLHIFLLICWVIIIAKFGDPNYDKWRVVCIIVAAVGICLVMGYRGDVKGKQEIINESNANKTADSIQNLEKLK